MAAAGGKDLADRGWGSGGFSHLIPSGADFLGDGGTTGGFNFDTAGDFLISPYIFGDSGASSLFEDVMLYVPTAMTMEVYGRFAANPDENASGFGFLESGAGFTSPSDADMMAFIGCGATNFELIRGDGTVDAGITVYDTDPHMFAIKFEGALANWYIDGVDQGSIGIQDNLWPTAFCINTESGGTADPCVSWVHIFYS
jgi:hypothetical protein